MTYQDSYTMWHDVPCVNGNPSSNNGYIYSAYSKYLKPNTLDTNLLKLLYDGCLIMRYPLLVTRLPGKFTPPTSHDEIIGMVSLGLLDYNTLERSYFNFCSIDYGERRLTLVSFIKALRAIYGARNEDRNYLWKNKVYDAYPLMFKLKPWDIYYVKRFHNKSVNLLELLSFYVNFIYVFTKGDKSSRLMLWLQLCDMKHKLLKFIPVSKWVSDYFTVGHPFRR